MMTTVPLKEAKERLELLGITPAHLDGVRALPFHHKDPFDRLLVAQALSDELVLLSRDGALEVVKLSDDVQGEGD